MGAPFATNWMYFAILYIFHRLGPLLSRGVGVGRRGTAHDTSSSLRRHDGGCNSLIPAKAGIHPSERAVRAELWASAFAGARGERTGRGTPHFVIPAKAGIQGGWLSVLGPWMPACAGMTEYVFSPAPAPLPRSPAKAGIHTSELAARAELWAPAFAGARGRRWRDLPPRLVDVPEEHRHRQRPMIVRHPGAHIQRRVHLHKVKPHHVHG